MHPQLTLSGSPTAPAQNKKSTALRGLPTLMGPRDLAPMLPTRETSSGLTLPLVHILLKGTPSESSVKAQARQDPNTVLWALDVLMLI